MKHSNRLSAEEEEAIGSLGGFDRATAVADQVLARHGFHRGLFTKSEREQIHYDRRCQRHSIEFHSDAGKSLRANINDLLAQASDLQATGGGPNYVGAMLQ